MNEIENIDYVVCEICGKKVKKLNNTHLKKHEITLSEYKILYPKSLIISENSYLKSMENGGKHMKTDHYKNICSEKFKGENNPNHKSKTTELERKKRSPHCKEFYNNLTDSEIDIKIKDVIKKSNENKEINKKITTRIDYYLNLGYSEEESKQKLKERQTTFSKEKCIEKFDEIEGLRIFTERQIKWQTKLNSNGNLKCGFSKISQELFYSIFKKYNINDLDNIHFATKNSEYKIKKESGGIWLYDFVDLNKMKIIEYNGDIYHANPNIYKFNDTPHPFRKNILAKEIWEKDDLKLNLAKNQNFEVLIIWDSEYRLNKEKTLEKCLKFLQL